MKITDNELRRLVAKFQDGDECAFDRIAHALRVTIRSEAASFKPIGIDIEDRQQICRVALFNAVSNFDESRKVSFLHYAKQLMRNALTDLFRAQNAESRNPGGHVFSLDVSISDDDSATLGDTLISHSRIDADIDDAETAAAARAEFCQLMADKVQQLSDTDSAAWSMLVEDYFIAVLPDHPLRAEISDVLSQDGSQFALFDFVARRGTDAAADVMMRASEIVVPVAWRVISSTIQGDSVVEIAKDNNLPELWVSRMRRLAAGMPADAQCVAA